MARTRATDYEEKETAILDTATQLFSREGVERTSMARIAAASGNSKAVLYHYYDSKESLLFEIVSRHLDTLIQIIHEARQSGQTQQEQLNAMIEVLLKAYQQYEDQHRIQLAGLPSLSSEHHAHIVNQQRQLVDEFAGVIVAMMPTSQQRTLLKPITMSLFGILNWHYTWFRDKGSMSVDDYASLVTNLILNGIQLQPGQPCTGSKLDPDRRHP